MQAQGVSTGHTPLTLSCAPADAEAGPGDEPDKSRRPLFSTNTGEACRHSSPGRISGLGRSLSNWPPKLPLELACLLGGGPPGLHTAFALSMPTCSTACTAPCAPSSVTMQSVACEPILHTVQVMRATIARLLSEAAAINSLQKECMASSHVHLRPTKRSSADSHCHPHLS